MSEEDLEAQAEIPQEEAPEESAGDVYDRLTQDGPARDENGRFKAQAVEEEQPEAEGEEPETEEPEGEEEEEALSLDGIPEELSNNLPFAIRRHWADIPKEAQEAFLESHMKMHQRAMDAGRVSSELRPLQDAIETAKRTHPALEGMPPEQLGQEIVTLVNIRENFVKDPVNTLLSMAQNIGVMNELAQAMGQEPQENDIMSAVRELRALKNEIPSLIDNRFGEVQQQAALKQVQAQVEEFAADRPHFQLLEPQLAEFIRQTQERQPALEGIKLLEAAYDEAMKHFNLSAPESAPAEAPATDPKRTEAAIKAKSVNVKSKAGKPAPLSGKEALAAAYDRAMSA